MGLRGYCLASICLILVLAVDGFSKAFAQSAENPSVSPDWIQRNVTPQYLSTRSFFSPELNDHDPEIEALIQAMTLEEKLGLLCPSWQLAAQVVHANIIRSS